MAATESQIRAQLSYSKIEKQITKSPFYHPEFKGEKAPAKARAYLKENGKSLFVLWPNGSKQAGMNYSVSVKVEANIEHAVLWLSEGIEREHIGFVGSILVLPNKGKTVYGAFYSIEEVIEHFIPKMPALPRALLYPSPTVVSVPVSKAAATASTSTSFLPLMQAHAAIDQKTAKEAEKQALTELDPPSFLFGSEWGTATEYFRTITEDPNYFKVSPTHSIGYSKKPDGSVYDTFKLIIQRNGQVFVGRILYSPRGFQLEFPMGSAELSEPGSSILAMVKYMEDKTIGLKQKAISTDPNYLENGSNITDEAVVQMLTNQNKQYYIRSKPGQQKDEQYHVLTLKYNDKYQHWDLFFSKEGFQATPVGLDMLMPPQLTVAKLVQSLQDRYSEKMKLKHDTLFAASKKANRK